MIDSETEKRVINVLSYVFLFFFVLQLYRGVNRAGGAIDGDISAEKADVRMIFAYFVI